MPNSFYHAIYHAIYHAVALRSPRLTCLLRPRRDINQAAFAEYMYQWAATLTQSGANFPFILPVKADKYATGWKVSRRPDLAPRRHVDRRVTRMKYAAHAATV